MSASEINTKEILAWIKTLSNAKGIEAESIFDAVENALEKALEKSFEASSEEYSDGLSIKVKMDRESGAYDIYRCWDVIEDDDFDELAASVKISLSDAQKQDQDVEIGGKILQPMEAISLGRIGVQTVRQVIIQQVREAERRSIVNNYQERIGSLLTGVVKKVTREHVLIDLGDGVEALLTRDKMLPNEALRMNDRVRAYLFDARYEPRGPQLFVSRTCPEMVMELFKIEVPEIGEEVIEIKSAARDPGARAKIAVKTNDGRIDPIGACVGMRGSRVQAVSSELGGERVDIILWDDNPAQLVINAMAPAEVESIVLDEDTRTIDIAVSKEQLSQAIGRSGQNVRLASELTGWTLNVMSAEEAQEKSEVETETIVKNFMEQLEIDEDVAAVLIQEGFSSIEEIAYVPIEELLEIEEFDEEIIEELRNRSKDALLMKALASEEELSEAQPAQDLLDMEGMTQELAVTLAKKEVKTMEDLAELAVDDLLEITSGLNEEQAAQLIMTARKPWFDE